MTAVNIYNTSTNSTPVTTLTPNTPPGGSGVSFSDILNAVNPLQHIPVLSDVYRSVTGTTISAGSQIAGDTLYGAILGAPALIGAALGFASSSTDVAVEKTTGESIAGHVLATLGVGGSSTTVASNATPLVGDASNGSAAPTPSVMPTQNNALQAQVQSAVQLITHQGNYPDRSNVQYQHAQIHDAMNKYLTKMVV